jgi:hypothetical protein
LLFISPTLCQKCVKFRFLSLTLISNSPKPTVTAWAERERNDPMKKAKPTCILNANHHLLALEDAAAKDEAAKNTVQRGRKQSKL